MTRTTHDHCAPVVGITGPDRGGGAAWIFTWFAVTLAGGCARRITPKHPCDIDSLDALIIGGGADVDPKLYGGPDLVTLAHVDEKRGSLPRRMLGWLLFPLTWLLRKFSGLAGAHAGQDAARDALEMKLMDQAVQRRLPILGICRGEQLLNVYFGGSLHRALTGFYVEDPEVRTILPRKRIRLVEGTRLRAIMARETMRVNALHRQAIDRLGRGLHAAARDRNEIVQAIEHESLPLVVGVQWHPEYLPQVPEQRRIFRALVEHARRRIKSPAASGFSELFQSAATR